MSIIVAVAVEGAVVNVQKLGASHQGILTSEDFLICKKHLAEMLAAFMTYRAVMQDGGCRNCTKLSICLLTNPELLWQNFHCHGFILCNPEVFSVDIIAGSEITMWNIQCENFVNEELL